MNEGVWQPGDAPLPALYIGHGAPPLLDDPAWPNQLNAVARSIARPTAILIVSAHWEVAPLAISNPNAKTPLVYDFYGFEDRFYRMKYETPDASHLLAQVDSVLPHPETLHRHSRGLDHGAWVPLKVMYPDAEIPVLQLSIPTHDPERLIRLGRQLRPLREEGVLIIGSGFLTHGLPFLRPEDWAGLSPRPPSWSQDFDLWAAEAFARGDVDELTRYRTVAPGMPYAHPTVEHFTPLFITLGTATDPGSPPDTPIDGFFMGLSKRSIQVV